MVLRLKELRLLELERIGCCVLKSVEIGIKRAGSRVSSAETLDIELEMPTT